MVTSRAITDYGPYLWSSRGQKSFAFANICIQLVTLEKRAILVFLQTVPASLFESKKSSWVNQLYCNWIKCLKTHSFPIHLKQLHCTHLEMNDRHQSWILVFVKRKLGIVGIKLLRPCDSIKLRVFPQNHWETWRHRQDSNLRCAQSELRAFTR